jgi:hypothetical protein
VSGTAEQEQEMSSDATGDTQPEPAVVTDEPAAVHVPAPSVPADPAELANLADVPHQADPADAADAAIAAEPADGAGEPAARADEAADEGQADGEPAAANVAENVNVAGADGRNDEEAEADAAEPAGEFRPARRWPRILLAAGFVMAAAAIVVGAIAIVGSLTHGFKKPVKITYKKSAVFSLKTGDCLNPSGQSYTLIACDSPHEAEVFATFTLAGATWPGNAAAATAASNGCKTRLSGYLNPELAISLASTYVYPDAVAWQAGTRTVICEVRASSGQLTGSVRGASATAG